MSFVPDASQRLLLWRLAVSEEGKEFVKDIETKSFTAAKRQPLAREGLIVESKLKFGGKGRALPHLELTDKGWAWCQSHLGEPFKFRGPTPKLAGVVLERLLGLLQRYFEAQDQTASFGEFVLQSRSQKRAAEPASGHGYDRDGQSDRIASQVRKACRDLANGRDNSRIRLSELRDRVRVERHVLDQTLFDMERSGELSLYELNDPREIQDSDRDAALRTSTGNPRHVVYFGGQAS